MSYGVNLVKLYLQSVRGRVEGQLGDTLYGLFQIIIGYLGLKVVEIPRLFKQPDKLGVIKDLGVIVYGGTPQLGFHVDRGYTADALHEFLKSNALGLIVFQNRTFNPQPARRIRHVIVHALS